MSHGGRFRILFLEDDPKFRRLMIPALEALGCVVIQATSTQEASMEIQHGKFDLLIVDGNLPGVDGATWIAELKRNNIAVPVVFVTGAWRDTESFKRLVADYDVALIIHKPVTPVRFAQQIALVLNHGQGNELESNPELADQFKMLKKEYVQDISNQFAEISSVVRDLETNGWQTTKAYEAMRLTHMMSGTAGSFGFFAIGMIASTIETRLRQHNDTATLKFWDKLDGMLDVLHKMIEQAQQDAPYRPDDKYARDLPIDANFIAPVILIFDSDNSFRQKAEIMLASEGMIVTSFEDLIHLEQVLSSVSPALLIFNAEISNENLAERLHSAGLGKDAQNPTPILFVGEAAGAEDLCSSIGKERTYYLQKPITNRDLLAMVKSFLGQTSKQLVVRQNSSVINNAARPSI